MQKVKGRQKQGVTRTSGIRRCLALENEAQEMAVKGEFVFRRDGVARSVLHYFTATNEKYLEASQVVDQGPCILANQCGVSTWGRTELNEAAAAAASIDFLLGIENWQSTESHWSHILGDGIMYIYS